MRQASGSATNIATQSTTIESLKILNYRSCIDTRIDLQPDLSVLIGPNGTGKTTVLTAFFLLQSLAVETPFPTEVEEALNPCRLKASFKYNGSRAVLRTDIQLRTDESNKDVILKAIQSWNAKEFTGSSRGIKVPLWLAHREFFRYELPRLYRFRLRSSSHQEPLPPQFKPVIKAIGTFLQEMKYYSASQFTNPSLCPVSFEVEQEGSRRRAVRLRGHGRFLYDLYKARQTLSYAQFLQVIGPSGVDLINEIRFKEIPTSSVDYQVRSGGQIQKRTQEKLLVVPQFVIGKNALSPSQLSEGTFKTITLLFYLMTEKSSVLLIEEPEVCVHHGLLTSIVELIKTYSKQKQIILSTHSDFVLDQIEPRHLYEVSRTTDLGTVVTHVTKAMSRGESNAPILAARTIQGLRDTSESGVSQRGSS